MRGSEPSASIAACRDNYGKYFSKKTAHHLVNNYSANVVNIVKYAKLDTALAEHVSGTTGDIKADLSYVIDHEMVCTLSDLILRRTKPSIIVPICWRGDGAGIRLQKKSMCRVCSIITRCGRSNMPNHRHSSRRISKSSSG